LRSTGTPVAGLIVLHPGIQFKAVEGDSLAADGDLGEAWADLGVEAVSVHAEVGRGIPEADQAG